MEANSLLTPATGKVPAHAVAPDPIEGSRHDVKRGRTKRGPTAEVKRYGLAHVVGSWHGAPVNHDNGAESYGVLAQVLEQSGSLKRGAYGVSALDVYRLTQRLYGDVIPPLLSTDNQQHHAVVHGDDSDTDDYAVAWHNPPDPYAACDAIGMTVPDSSIEYQTRGYRLTFGLPTECVTDRWKLAAWLSSKREHSSEEAGRVMARRVRTGPESKLHWSSRQYLKRATPRVSDPTDQWTALHNGYGAVIAVALGHAAYRWELLAPCDQTAVRESIDLTDRPAQYVKGTMVYRTRESVGTGPSAEVWLGHSNVKRAEPKHGTSTGGKRKRTAIAKRTVEHFHAADFATLCWLFAKLERGERVTWECQTMSGTFTRAADGRYSLDSEAVKVRSVRTLLAVERKLEHAA